MIAGAAPVLVTFDGRVQCVYCAGAEPFCVVCDFTGVIETLEAIDREDCEPVKFLEGA